MPRRVRLVGHRTRRPHGVPLPPAASDSPDTPLDLSLRFSGGRGFAVLENQALACGIAVESLEMRIPNIAFPFDMSRGVTGLRHRRLQLHRLVLSVERDGVEAWLRHRAKKVDWLSDPVVSFESDHVAVAARFGAVHPTTRLSFRLLWDVSGSQVAALIDEARAVGPLPLPALHAACASASALSGWDRDGVVLRCPWALRWVLAHLLAPRGWRLPAWSHVQVTAVHFAADHIRIVWEADGVDARTGNSLALLQRKEELRLCADADRILADGDAAAARTAYAALLDHLADNPLVAARIASIDVLDAPSRPQVAAWVRGAEDVSQWRSPMLAALLHGAAVLQEAAVERAAIAALFPRSGAAEQRALALRMAALSTAEDAASLRAMLDAVATRWEHDPHLLEHRLWAAAVSGDAHAVRTLGATYLGVHQEPAALGRAHRLLGQLWFEELDDPKTARSHFERAMHLAPDDREAAWGAWETAAACGDVETALMGFDRLAASARDDDERARILAAMGELWLREGHWDLAVSRLVASLEHREDSTVRRLLAEALAAQNRHQDAAAQLEKILSAQRERDAQWAQTALALARLYADKLDAPERADQLVRAAEGSPEVAPQAMRLRMELAERLGDYEGLAGLIERALVTARTEGAAEGELVDLSVRLIHARLGAGDVQAALSTARGLLQRFPEHAGLLEAAAAAAEQAGDAALLRDALTRRFHAATDDRATWAVRLGWVWLQDFENASEALAWFRQAREEDPSLRAAYEGEAACHRRLNDTDALAAVLAHLVNDAAGDVDPAHVLEWAQLVRGTPTWPDAAEALKRVLPSLSGQERLEALRMLAHDHLAAGRWREARDLFARVRAASPHEDFDAALGEAKAAVHLGAMAEAFDAAAAAGSGPESLRKEAALLAAAAAPALGRAEEAVSLLCRVAENLDNAEDAAQLWEKAAALATDLLDDARLAASCYEALLELFPDRALYRNRLCALLEQAGDRRALAQALVRYAPQSATQHADLVRAAEFLMAENLLDEAADALSRALRIRPDAETARLLAAVHRRKGDPGAAVPVLQPFAAHDDAAADLLVTCARDAGMDTTSLLQEVAYADSVKEAGRLVALAHNWASQQRLAQAVGAVIDAFAADPETAGPVLVDAVEWARSVRDPQLAEELLQVAHDALSTELRNSLSLALCGMWSALSEPERAAQAVARLEPPIPFDELVSTAVAYPDCAPLLALAREEAERRGREEDVVSLLCLQIERVEGPAKVPLLRALAHASARLGDYDAAADAWRSVARCESLDDEDTETYVTALWHAGRLCEDGRAVAGYLDVLERRGAREQARELLESLTDLAKKKGDTAIAGWALERLAAYLPKDAAVDALVHAARHAGDLGDAQRAAALLHQAATLSPDEPDVLLGLADAAWETGDLRTVVAKLERLFVVAPGFALDPVRRYRLGIAAHDTGAWPDQDVRELLESILPALDEATRNRAQDVLARLGQRRTSR